jgi:hypothetical protein
MNPCAVAVATLAASVIACGGGSASRPLAPAGVLDDLQADDGTGQLARASVKFTTGPADERFDTFADESRSDYPIYDDFGGFQYGGATGGNLYGGANYANYNPQISWNQVQRTPTYEIRSLGDAGSISGQVTWTAAPGARRINSPCGEIDNPTLRLGAKNEAGGAIVYLDDIKGGKPLSIALRPLAIGGTVETMECALRPTAQVLSPAPGTLTVYAGADRDVMIAKGPTGEPVTLELAGGGYQQIGAAVGMTSVADKAGKLVPAWIFAPGHPYFAITDDDGRFQIGDVVPGTYKLVVWHPPVVTGWRDGKPVHGAPVVTTRTVKLGAYGTAKADVTLK